MTENSTTNLTRHGVSSMQVKIFSGNNFASTEKDLNEWLLYNSVMVQHIGQSQCERNGNLLVAISVFYTMKNNKTN